MKGENRQQLTVMSWSRKLGMFQSKELIQNNVCLYIPQ